jgi:hypothetical protein
MRRLNPIVVGSLILAPSILGVELYLLFGSHRRPAPTIAAPEPAELPVAPRPRTVAAQIAPPPVPRPPPSQDLPSATDDVIDGGTELALLRRQKALVANRLQMIRQADEETFQTLNLPEATRAAIRAIDDDYTRANEAFQARREADQAAGVDSRLPAGDINAEQTRHAAIASLLGPAGASAFAAAERKAERQVRNRLRPQWVRGL